jgi:hypothetical protein
MGNIQGTFREHSGNTQGTFREHSRNIQGTFREHSGNTQGTFRERAGKNGMLSVFCNVDGMLNVFHAFIQH